MAKRTNGFKPTKALSLFDATIQRPLANTVIGWNPKTKEVFTWSGGGRHPQGDPFPQTAGADYADWRKASDELRLGMLLATIATMIVRDGIEYKAIHNELILCPEYRALFPDDCP